MSDQNHPTLEIVIQRAVKRIRFGDVRISVRSHTRGVTAACGVIQHISLCTKSGGLDDPEEPNLDEPPESES